LKLHLIDNKNSYITRALAARLPTEEGLASHSHERLYTSNANVDGRRGWMTKRKKGRNG